MGWIGRTMDSIVIFVALILFASFIILFFTGVPSGLDAEITKTKAKETYSQDITLMSYNIHYGSGYANDYIKEAKGSAVYKYLDQVADIIKDADIVVLEEADVSVKRSHYIDEVDYLASKADFPYTAFADDWNIVLPLTGLVKFSRLRTGHAILSKYPIDNHEIYVYEKNSPWWRNVFFVWRTQQIADIRIGQKNLRLYNVHLESEYKTDREYQAEQLKNMVKDRTTPTIMIGDFNALVDEAAKKDFPNENYLGDVTMQTIRQAGLNELFGEEYKKDEQRYFTFPSRSPDRRLDYMFYSTDFDIISAEVLNNKTLKEASDHLPLKVRLRFKE